MTTALAPKPKTTRVELLPPDASGKRSTALVQLADDGTNIRAIRQVIELRPELGETYPVRVKIDDRWVDREAPTAVGLTKLNLVAGISQKVPPTLLDYDGKPRPNPSVEKSEDGSVIAVRVRMIGSRIGSTGQVVRYDLTLHYDLEIEFAHTLMQRWRGRDDKAEPASWGVLCPTGAKPNNCPPDQWKPWNMPGEVTLWLDLRSNEVRYLLQERLRKMQVASASAVTFVWRNILKKLLGLGGALPTDRQVGVTGWIGEDRTLDMVPDDETIEGADLDADVASVTEDDIQAAEADDHDEDQAAPPDELPMDIGTEPSVDPDPDVHRDDADAKLRSDLFANFRSMHSQIGVDKYRTCLKAVGIESSEALIACQDLDRLIRGYDLMRDELHDLDDEESARQKAKADEAKQAVPDAPKTDEKKESKDDAPWED